MKLGGNEGVGWGAATPCSRRCVGWPLHPQLRFRCFFMAFKRFRCHQIDQSEKQSDGANKKESHL